MDLDNAHLNLTSFLIPRKSTTDKFKITIYMGAIFNAQPLYVLLHSIEALQRGGRALWGRDSSECHKHSICPRRYLAVTGQGACGTDRRRAHCCGSGPAASVAAEHDRPGENPVLPKPWKEWILTRLPTGSLLSLFLWCKAGWRQTGPRVVLLALNTHGRSTAAN